MTLAFVKFAGAKVVTLQKTRKKNIYSDFTHILLLVQYSYNQQFTKSPIYVYCISLSSNSFDFPSSPNSFSIMLIRIFVMEEGDKPTIFATVLGLK